MSTVIPSKRTTSPNAASDLKRMKKEKIELACDLLNESEHEKLDQLVLDSCKNSLYSLKMVDTAGDALHVLGFVIYSAPKMKPNAFSIVFGLLMEDPLYLEAFKEAFKKKSFKEVRNWACLREDVPLEGEVLKSEPQVSENFCHDVMLNSWDNMMYEPSASATLKSWDINYEGSAPECLYEVIKMSIQKWRENVYAPYRSLIQSSGMGKSRCVDQLAKSHLVIPLNLRPKPSGFPAADSETVCQWIFFAYNGQSRNLQMWHAFLTALFTKAQEYLENMDEKITREVNALPYGDRPTSLAAKFRLFMTAGQTFASQGPLRTNFYKAVVKQAEKQMQEISSKIGPSRSSENVLGDDQEGVRKLRAAALKLHEFLKQHCGDDPVSLILAFDEVHSLTTPEQSFVNAPWSRFGELRHALRALRDVPFFSLFLSTSCKIQPSAKPNLSNRPFCTFGFDQLAKQICDDGTTALKNVITDEYMAHLGRPLFGSRWSCGGYEIRRDTLGFAAAKLLCKTGWPDKVTILTFEEELACLCVRFPLDFNATTAEPQEIEKVLVERHMRVCLSIDSEGQTMVTTAASEPLLAEAAYIIMQILSFDIPAKLLRVLEVPGMDKWDRGDLVAMTLLMLARDRAAAKHGRDIPFLDFLKNLFPAEAHESILKSKPSFFRVEEENQSLETAFAGAYVHFNHFIRYNGYKAVDRKHIWALMARGAAVLCATGEDGIDILVPVLYHNDVLRRTAMSGLLVRLKNNKHFFSTIPKQYLFDAMDPVDVGFFEKDEEDPLPIVRAVFALGTTQSCVIPVEREFRDQLPQATHESSNDFTAYDIWCAGASHTTFGVIKREDENVYRKLLNIDSTVPKFYEDAEIESQVPLTRNMVPGTAAEDDHWPFVRSE